MRAKLRESLESRKRWRGMWEDESRVGASVQVEGRKRRNFQDMRVTFKLDIQETTKVC